MEQTLSRTSSRRAENVSFTCLHCGAAVSPSATGSFRNHCPRCLWSRHVDVFPGDRAAACGGPMAPVALDHAAKGWVIVHRCTACGHTSRNRATLDDPIQPDDPAALAALSALPPP
ncbi:RNHCP domain-containing protein [Nakamurella aerolata]|uniref:RNHCP domain-containing protein n=1 Tax=Nakamurella aerolata TaxID=1656892 RepID=UPI001BB21931